MIRALMTAASGMKAQQMQVDTIANNIANANTSSFKKSELSFRSMLYQTYREPGAVTAGEQRTPTGLQVGTGTEVSGSSKIFQQGEPEPESESGNPEVGIGHRGDGRRSRVKTPRIGCIRRATGQMKWMDRVRKPRTPPSPRRCLAVLSASIVFDFPQGNGKLRGSRARERPGPRFRWGRRPPTEPDAWT